MSGRRHPRDLEMLQARRINVGDRIILDGRGLTPWTVTASYERAESSQYWSLTVKRGRETNIIRTFSDSWFDKVA
jgi:hypothetical protein